MHPQNKVDELKQALKNKKETEEKKEGEEGASQFKTLEEDLAKAKEEAKENNEKYVRLYAEFENFRKRAAKEKSDLSQYAQEKVVLEVLPILDDLERALSHAQGNADPKVLFQGIEMVQKQFQGVLSKFGLTPFDSLGEPFNPHVHEAVAHLESQDYPPHSVVAEYRKGYKMGDKLIRPAMVAVSKESSLNDVAGAAQVGEPRSS